MTSQTSDPAILAPIEDVPPSRGRDAEQTAEWLEALDQVIGADGAREASELLQALLNRAAQAGVFVPLQFNTPYVNTIPTNQEVAFPGDRALELRIESLIRYNALAMVAHANKKDENIGGHMASFASLATLPQGETFQRPIPISLSGTPNDKAKSSHLRRAVARRRADFQGSRHRGVFPAQSRQGQG